MRFMSGIQHTGMMRNHRSIVPTGGGGPDWPELDARRAVRRGASAPGVLLKETVERDIVPHLLTLHPTGLRDDRPPNPPETAPLAFAFAREAAGDHPEHMFAHLESLLEGGAAPDRVCLDVLAPAARHLGDLWVQDDYDFVAVTIGVMQLQQAMLHLLPRDALRPQPAGRAASILMVPVPGNDHTFGLAMAADFFRRAGWAVSSGAPPRLEALQHRLRTRRFDAIGFSVSCEAQLEMLARSIAAVRDASCNPRIVTVIGGPLFMNDPQLALQFGADMVATDGAQAPHQLALLLPDLEVGLKAVASLARGRSE